MAEFQLPKLTTRVRFPSLAPNNFYMIQQIRSKILFFILACFFNGCASVQTVEPPASVAPSQGVYHKVSKGETLWGIAKAYGVNIDDIIKSNRIPDGAHLEENQLLLIPKETHAQSSTPAASGVIDTNKESFNWPLQGRILNYFGDRRGGVPNKGVHILGQEGQPVLASRQGKVIFADYLAGYAYTLIVDHADGFFSIYSQNEKLLVRLGDFVAKGQEIALLGRQGNLAFLHFEIRKGGKADNPLYYLPQH